MTKFENHLILSGFIPYRSTDKGFTVCHKNGFYSTQAISGVYYETTYYKRGNIIIPFGLTERGVPPTVQEIIDTDHKKAHHFVTSNEPDCVLDVCIANAFIYDSEYLSRFIK